MGGYAFTVTLLLQRVAPKAEEHREPAQFQAESTIAANSLRVLLAEDNPASAFYLMELFNSALKKTVFG